MSVFALIIFGILAFRSMPVGLFPNVDFPIISIQTTYIGADPDTVETKITKKIEDAVFAIDGVSKVLSESADSISVVTVIFSLDKNLEEAANDVRDKISALVLPKDVNRPLIQKANSAGGSVLDVFVSRKDGNNAALMDMIDNKLKPLIQRISGVAEVNIIGHLDKEIKIITDPFLLNKYKIALSTVTSQIAKENFRSFGGKLKTSLSETTIKVRGDATSIEDLKNIRIQNDVRLGDIAKISLDLSDAKSYSSFNKKQGLVVEIKKISGANSLELINEFKKIFPNLQKELEKDYELFIAKDDSQKILVNIDNVKFDLALGAFLCIVVVFGFLRNLNATIIASLVIPTSVIGSFALINALGFDLNRLTLVGLTLSIGIFIDDAIVVIENIAKKLEQGATTFMASFAGVQEIAFSIFAISSVLLSVFLPVAFMEGIVGKFFNSFAMTVAAGVIISFFVAISFIPAVSARFLSANHSRFFIATEPLFVRVDGMYKELLRVLIRHRYLTALGAFLLLIFSAFLPVAVDFIPFEDTSEMQIVIKTKPGTSLEEMIRKTSPIAQDLSNDPLVKYSVLKVGYTVAKESHKAKIYVKLVPVSKRIRSQDEIINDYRQKLKKYSDLFIVVEPLPPIDVGINNSPIQVVLQGDDLGVLEDLAQKTMQILKNQDGTIDVDSDYEAPRKEIKVSILRQNAARFGVSAQEVALALNSAFSGENAISSYEDSQDQIDIGFRFSDKNRQNLQDLKKVQITTKSGQLVSLEGLVEIKEQLAQTSINHFNKQRRISVTSNMTSNDLGAIIKVLKTELNKILPSGYSFSLLGNAEELEKTNKAFFMSVFLAVVLIYLILASLYESFVQPFIIMVSMPLSVTGVLLGLWISNNPFSLFVMIGVILLLGMVGKNAILVVDFANKAIQNGKNIEDALLEAGERRLRPILMTSFAMIGAMLPIAFLTHEGSQGNSPMAIAVIGGLISSTVLTLLVVPSLYRILYPLDRFLRKFYERKKI